MKNFALFSAQQDAMRILVLSSHEPEYVAHGLGTVLHNSLRCILELGHRIEMLVIADETELGHDFNCVQSRRDCFTTIPRTRYRRRVTPGWDALRTLIGSFQNRGEKLFSAEVRRRSRGFDLAVWFGGMGDPLTSKVLVECECPLILHVNDSITLTRRQRSVGIRGRIKTGAAVLQESSVINRLSTGQKGLVFVSDGDRKSALSVARTVQDRTVFTLPLAVDANVFVPADNYERRCPPVVLFTGNMNYGPNVSAAVRLVNNVLPLLHDAIEVRLVGRNPTESVSRLAGGDARVHITGEVNNIVAEYQRAAIFVAPISYSFGMKNKILEAMACALPIVATPEALSGFVGTPPGVLIGTTDRQLAELAGRLLKDESLRSSTGKAGRQHVLAHHSWLDRTRRLINLLSTEPEP